MPEKESTQPQEYKRSRFGGLELSKLSKKDIATALLKISLLTGGVAAATGTAMAQEGGTDAPTVEAVPEAPTANPNETAPAPTEVAPNGIAIEAGVTLTEEQIMEMPTEFLQLNAAGVMESVTVKSVGIRNNETAAMNEAGEVVMVHKEGIDSTNEWFIVALTVQGNIPWRVLISPTLQNEDGLNQVAENAAPKTHDLVSAESIRDPNAAHLFGYTVDAEVNDQPPVSAPGIKSAYGIEDLHPIYEGSHPTNGQEILDRAIEYVISTATGSDYQTVRQRLADGESFDLTLPGGRVLTFDSSWGEMSIPVTPEEDQVWNTSKGIDMVLTRDFSDDDYQIMANLNIVQSGGMPSFTMVDPETGALRIKQQMLYGFDNGQGSAFTLLNSLSEITAFYGAETSELASGGQRTEDPQLLAILPAITGEETYTWPFKFAASHQPISAGEPIPAP